LHRHTDLSNSGDRPVLVSEPTLYLSTPAASISDVPSFAADEHVYDRYTLLRSFLALVQNGRTAIEVPGDLRELIEAVYDGHPGGGPSEAWTRALRAAYEEAKDEQRQVEHCAQNHLIPPPDYPDDVLEVFSQGLKEDDPDTHPSLQARTRSTRQTVRLVCLHQCDNQYFLDRFQERAIDPLQVPKGANERSEWADALIRRSVPISHRGVVNHLAAASVSEWRRVPMLRHHRLALFTDGRCPVGGYTIIDDPEVGIEIEKEG